MRRTGWPILDNNGTVIICLKGWLLGNPSEAHECTLLASKHHISALPFFSFPRTAYVLTTCDGWSSVKGLCAIMFQSLVTLVYLPRLLTLRAIAASFESWKSRLMLPTCARL